MRFKGKTIFWFWLCFFGISSAIACKNVPSAEEKKQQLSKQILESKANNPRPVGNVLTGADKFIATKISELAGKKVGVLTNHTAVLRDGRHLIDALLEAKVAVKKVFSPEHGFRGTADAGEKVNSSTDAKTGLPIISLYGNNKKPTPEQLAGIDVLVFDIQDVGTRHYTYISSLTYLMEACAEQKKPLIIFDRPNPNGWYVDGPVMEKSYTSFIGMHTVPIVHGMTTGEYAKMVNGEGWLKGGVKCNLLVIPCENYHHVMKWTDTGLAWIAPSPNMGSDYAAFLYPILCWYEATPVSVGRGTDEAFTILGAPWHKNFGKHSGIGDNSSFGLTWEIFDFTPRSIVGKAKNPPFQDKTCQGIRFMSTADGKNLFLAGISLLQAFYQSYQKSGQTKPFFIEGTEKWTGYSNFRNEISSQKSPEEIYQSWQPKVTAFKAIRKKYLFYEE
ncbi:MAG: exo-beta-N-acetylmuramidase NamZ domain-containing protein [Bacteroidia bacterium]